MVHVPGVPGGLHSASLFRGGRLCFRNEAGMDPLSGAAVWNQRGINDGVFRCRHVIRHSVAYHDSKASAIPHY